MKQQLNRRAVQSGHFSPDQLNRHADTFIEVYQGGCASAVRGSAGRSPTVRTLQHLRRLGYFAQVVERWNPFAREVDCSKEVTF